MKTVPLETSIFCRAAVELPVSASAPREIMYMPGGLHTITPMAGAENPVQILVDRNGARELERQRLALVAKGKRPYCDFNHEDGEASFWPESFYWKDSPEPGIYCRPEWTDEGETKVVGKAWRQFSPVFHVDNKSGTPARIVCREWAKPNMGGLVNDPAFHKILPLWAKDAASAAAPGAHPDQKPNTTNTVNEQDIAALRATIQELNNELNGLRSNEAALKAKKENADLVSAEIRAKEHELRHNEARLENESLKAKNKVQGDAIQARNKADASAAVKRAVDRGAIPAKDTANQDALVAKATDDPSFITVIDSLQGNPALGGRITSPNVVITAEAPNATMKAYAAIVCKNAKLPMTPDTAKIKGQLARDAAALFAKDIDKNAVIIDMPMDVAIVAADNSDASVGLLSGTLVLQRALPLLQYEYPVLGTITQDFSDAPGLLDQTEVTRIILKPAVQTYDNTLDSSGRPKGWSTISPAQSVDVRITLDEHVGVPIVFVQTLLSQTVRNLFAEQAPMALYALGGYAVNKLTALMTAENFNAYAGTTATAGATTEGDTTITVTSTANMYPGQAISGTGIVVGTHIASVTDATHAELTIAATATNAALTFTLSESKVPNTYATLAVAKADFNGAQVGKIRSAFSTNEVPMAGRFLMLNGDYYDQLSNDPVLNTFFAAYRNPEIVTEGTLPKVKSFMPMEAPYFPTTNHRTGFAGQKASLALKSRLPSDFTKATGAMVPGSVTTVTVPGGISVMLVEYVSLQAGYAEWRPEVLLGAAVGDRRTGLVITSQ